MSVELAHPAAEKVVLVLEGIGGDVLVLEGIGGDKIRIDSTSLDQPLTVLPDQALEIVAIAKITIFSRSGVDA
jgi:hypothetical protein